ncbi:hypothetical protein SGPA1_41285 [Streptomyces misionensis JCM 4497]
MSLWRVRRYELLVRGTCRADRRRQAARTARAVDQAQQASELSPNVKKHEPRQTTDTVLASMAWVPLNEIISWNSPAGLAGICCRCSSDSESRNVSSVQARTMVSVATVMYLLLRVFGVPLSTGRLLHDVAVPNLQGN